MVGNLRRVMAKAVEAYAATARKQWVLEWPGQAVLAVTGIYWTQAVAAALEGGVPGALKAVGERNTADLADIVTLVRGRLERLQRATLSALVVMDVHARDAAVELAAQVRRAGCRCPLPVCLPLPAALLAAARCLLPVCSPPASRKRVAHTAGH
jgi:dynein heavy chain, axonemal